MSKEVVKKPGKLSFAASSAERWTVCPASVRASVGIPSDDSTYSLEGKAAHEIATQCLLSNTLTAKDFFEKTIHETLVDSSMVDFTALYIDYVKVIYSKVHDGLMAIEQKVYYSNIAEGASGIADAIIIDKDNKILHVIDFKYGLGVRVDAYENFQCLLYAIGSLNKYPDIEITDVKIHIVQPRMMNFSVYEVSVEEIKNRWIPFFQEKAKDALAEDAPFVPTDEGCQFCRVKPTCPALHAYFKYIETFTAPGYEISDIELSFVLDKRKLVGKFIKAVETKITKQISSGVNFSGYKLIPGKTKRYFDDNSRELLEELLKDKAYNTELITVGEAEKLLGKEIVDSIAARKTEEPVLVKILD